MKLVEEFLVGVSYQEVIPIVLPLEVHEVGDVLP